MLREIELDFGTKISLRNILTHNLVSFVLTEGDGETFGLNTFLTKEECQVLAEKLLELAK